ncbi:MAG: YiiD C-terminal domain-containing protein [Mariprofundaceae bacterium]
MKIDDLPFNKHIGLESDGETVRLKQQECLLNHVETLHASVLHGLAEAASGHYLILNLMPLFPDWLVLLKRAEMTYKRPASDDCRAKADVSDESLQACIDKLNRDKTAVLTVPVKVFCGTKVVATSEFDWWFRLKS